MTQQPTNRTILEEWEGHEVTAAAFDVNIGHGLVEAMRVQPELFKAGTIIDLVARIRVDNIRYDPKTKNDDKSPNHDGPWVRIHICKPLAAVPIDAEAKAAKTIRGVIDEHIKSIAAAKEASKNATEIEGQQALYDEEQRLEAEERAAAEANA